MVFVVGGGYASTINKQTEAGFLIRFRFLLDLGNEKTLKVIRYWNE